MRFETPRGVPFEIPDEWWTFAEMDAFARTGEYCLYRASTKHLKSTHPSSSRLTGMRW
jgi:hypothetical protein